MSTITTPYTYFSRSRLLWKHRDPQHTPVGVFRRTVNLKHGLGLANYHDLHRYSVEDYTFWVDLWEFLGIISSVPPDLQQIITAGKIPEIPIWFPGVMLNYAENLLYRNDSATALTTCGESGLVTNYTFQQLRELVRQMAAALRVNGLQIGDRVAVIATNSMHSVVLALATASIGAIFSITAPDMSTEGILDRYRQIRPKFVFSDTEVMHTGMAINLIPKITEVLRGLETTGPQRAILLPSTLSEKYLPHTIPNCIDLASFLDSGDDRELHFEQLPFSHPLCILYSSGTSGKPKCIVHSAGGVLLQTKKNLVLDFGLATDDTFLQYTTTGWIMWTFMLTGLACGARLVLYDGSPFYPDPQAFLKLIHDQRVAVLGISPNFLSEIHAKELKPLELGSFESLRVIASTGAVLTPWMFEKTFEAFGGKFHLISRSGGTDICSSFVTGTPLLPVYAGEIQCKSLGMKVEVWDHAGNNIEHTGTPGNDSSGEKLRRTYFNTYSDVWVQGDYLVINPSTKGIIILGRSDGVLNSRGLRFGSSEIYSVLERLGSNLHDSLCVGQRRPQDLNERVLLFLKMRPGVSLTPQIESEIKKEISRSLSPSHVPSHIFQVEDIPYTVNGKKIEMAVKQIISGAQLQPSGTVANPRSLMLYYKYRDFDQVKTKL